MGPRGHGEKWGRPKKEGFWTGRAKEGGKREESLKGPRDQRKEPMERSKVGRNVGVLLEEEFRIPLSLCRKERVIVLFNLCFGSCLLSSSLPPLSFAFSVLRLSSMPLTCTFSCGYIIYWVSWSLKHETVRNMEVWQGFNQLTCRAIFSTTDK